MNSSGRASSLGRPNRVSFKRDSRTQCRLTADSEVVCIGRHFSDEAAPLFVHPTNVVSTVSRRNLPAMIKQKGKGSPYSIAERRVPEQIPVLCR